MSGRYYDETEETLKKLDQRRSVLDKKTALRIAYIAEFNIVKAENRVKLQSLVQAQNIKAKERNAKLLQEVSAASIAAVNHSMDIYKSPFGVDSAKNSQKSDKLAEAKREYYKSIEVMLPQYKHDSIKAHEVEIMRIKAEKRVVDERRSKLQQEFEKEEIVKGYLEQERRALSLSLGEAIDAAIEHHLDKDNDEYQQFIATRNRCTFREAHEEIGLIFSPAKKHGFQGYSDNGIRYNGNNGYEGVRHFQTNDVYQKDNQYKNSNNESSNNNSNNNNNNNSSNNNNQNSNFNNSQNDNQNIDSNNRSYTDNKNQRDVSNDKFSPNNLIHSPSDRNNNNKNNNNSNSNNDNNDNNGSSNSRNNEKRHNNNNNDSNNNNIDNSHNDGDHDNRTRYNDNDYNNNDNNNNDNIRNNKNRNNNNSYNDNGNNNNNSVGHNKNDNDNNIRRDKETINPKDDVTNRPVLTLQHPSRTPDRTRNENKPIPLHEYFDENEKTKNSKSLFQSNSNFNSNSNPNIIQKDLDGKESSKQSGKTVSSRTSFTDNQSNNNSRINSQNVLSIPDPRSKESSSYSINDNQNNNHEYENSKNIRESDRRSEKHGNSSEAVRSYISGNENVLGRNEREQEQMNEQKRRREKEKEREKEEEEEDDGRRRIDFDNQDENRKNEIRKNKSSASIVSNNKNNDDDDNDDGDDNFNGRKNSNNSSNKSSNSNMNTKNNDNDRSSSSSKSNKSKSNSNNDNNISNNNIDKGNSSNKSNNSNHSDKNQSNNNDNINQTNPNNQQSNPTSSSSREERSASSKNVLRRNSTVSSASFNNLDPSPEINLSLSPPLFEHTAVTSSSKSKDLHNKSNSSIQVKEEENKEKNTLLQLNLIVVTSIAASNKILKILSTTILMKNQANSETNKGKSSVGRLYSHALTVLNNPRSSRNDGLIFEGSRSSNLNMMILVLLLAKNDIGISDEKETENSELLRNSEDLTLKKIENVYLCACVLHLIREYGSALLPAEALNGMITVERLKKCHKKVTYSAELWNAFVSHIRSVIEFDFGSFDDIARIITDVLIDHVSDDEKIRIDRKAVKLVKLAILPSDEMIPSSPLLTINTANSISASVSSSPLLRKSESFKNENKIDSQSKQQIKEQNKNDNDNNNNNIINKNNINNNQSRSLSASYELRKSTTLRNDDVSAVRKYSGHTYVRTSVDTGGGGETPYSSSTYTATASPVQSVGRYSIENLEFQDNKKSSAFTSTFGSRPSSSQGVRDSTVGRDQEKNYVYSNSKSSMQKRTELDEDEFEDEEEDPDPRSGIRKINTLSYSQSSLDMRKSTQSQNQNQNKKNIASPSITKNNLVSTKNNLKDGDEEFDF